MFPLVIPNSKIASESMLSTVLEQMWISFSDGIFAAISDRYSGYLSDCNSEANSDIKSDSNSDGYSDRYSGCNGLDINVL